MAKLKTFSFHQKILINKIIIRFSSTSIAIYCLLYLIFGVYSRNGLLWVYAPPPPFIQAICTFANILHNTRVYVKSWLNVYPIKMRQGNGNEWFEMWNSIYIIIRKPRSPTFKRNVATQYFLLLDFGWLMKIIVYEYIGKMNRSRNLIKLETLGKSIRDFVMRYCVITSMLNGNNFHLSAYWM